MQRAAASERVTLVITHGHDNARPGYRERRESKSKQRDHDATASMNVRPCAPAHQTHVGTLPSTG